MSGGISGPSGPTGPGGPEGPDGPDGASEISPAGAALTAEVERLRAAQHVGAADATSGVDDLERLAADLDAGRVTGDEALARLIAGMGVDLGEVDGAELRALLADLIATDPYLAELATRLGASGGEP